MIAGIVREPFAHPEWKALRGFLKRSCREGGDTTIEEVEAALRGTEAQLWAVFDGEKAILAAVTQLHITNGVKEAFCWQMGGDFKRAKAVLLPLFIDWARAEGCAAVEINGRIGWMRELRDWKAVSVVLRKELA